MENSWQRKCGTIWESMVAPVVSSPQESQNEILNAGYHFRSCLQAKPTSSLHRMAPEALLPWASSVSSYNLDHAELGSSLAPLLSGTQCNPAEVPIGSSNVNGYAAGNEFSLLTSGVVFQNLNSQGVGAGSDPYSVLSSKARVSAIHGSNSGPSNVLQDAYINLEKLELPQAGTRQNVFSNETELFFPSLRVGCAYGSIPSNACKIPNGHNAGPLHKPVPSVSFSSSTVTSGCPRVLCLNLSGELLLSDTGLFGVVCSCHGIHMSITKFSEHSGLCNVNPGVAVHLDSGETIAEWRKAYFQKYGIKIPEDHCGWDWPEGFSFTTGLKKHCPTLVSVSKGSDLWNHDGSSALLQSFNLGNSTAYPKNFHMVQKVPDQFAHSEKQKSAKEWVSSSSKNHMRSIAKNQKMMYSTSESSTITNLAGIKGSDNVCQPLPSHILPISRSGDPYVLHTHLQNLETFHKDIDIGRNSGSSNVELRLGQPSQQGQSSGGSMQLTFGSHIIGARGQTQNTFFLKQGVQRSCSKFVEDRRQHNYLDTCLSSSSKVTEQNQLDHVNQICGASSAVPSSFQIGQFKGDAAGGSLVSRSVAHLKYPLDGRIHSKSINDVVSGSHVMVSKFHSESPIAKPDQFSFPLIGGEASQRGFSSNFPGSPKHENRENGRSNIDNLQVPPELSFSSDSKSKGIIWNFGGGESGSDQKVYTGRKDESTTTTVCHLSGGMVDEPFRGNTLNYFGHALYPAQNGELVFSASRSPNFPMDFRRVLSTEVVPMGVLATNSFGVHSLTPLSKKENIGEGLSLMDGNVRVSAVPHMSDPANQNHPTTSFKPIPEPDKLRNFCEKSQVDISSPASDKRINEMNYVSLPKTSEVATQSVQFADFLFNNNSEAPSVRDKFCNSSVLSQGRYCHGKAAETQYQFASDLHSTRQLFLSKFGGTESISPSKVGKSSQGTPVGCFPSKYNLAMQTNSLIGRYDQSGKTILTGCNDQEGNAGSMVATLLGQKLGESSKFAEKVNSFENVKQNTKGAECNSFLWRSVPRKVVEKCNLASVENSADSSNGNVQHKFRKCFDETSNNVGLFEEQEMSNVSSGCSAPVVTQASVEVNNKDSSTVDAEDAMYAGNAIVDEGSGIERCWSSDDGVDSERNSKFSVFASKLNLGRRPYKPLLCELNCSLIGELRLRDSLRLRMQKHSHTDNSNQEKGTTVKKSVRDSKIWKRRVKWKKLTSSFSPSGVSNGTLECAGDAELHSPSVKDMKMLCQCDQRKFEACSYAVGRNIKHRSTLSLSADISLDRDEFRVHHVEEEKTDREMNLNADSDNMEAIGRKQLRLSGAIQASKQIHLHQSNCIDMDVAVKETPINCHTCSQAGNSSQRPRKPIVCGKYGVIANANSLKPAKTVSLRKLLKAPSKCSLPDSKVNLSSAKLLKKATVRGRNEYFYKYSKIKEEVNRNPHCGVEDELNPHYCMDEMKTDCSLVSREYDNLSHPMKRRRFHENKIQATTDGCQMIELRRKYKEVRIRSLNELTTKENPSSDIKFPVLENVESIPHEKSTFLCKHAAEADQISAKEICYAKISKDGKCQRPQDLDVICCVCGSSSKDESNDLLKCSSCLIKIHQACYGIPRVPKAHWYCRPCKTNSKNIVCVLCGYGGGAMTLALHSHKTVKSLLQAWNVIAEKNLSSSNSSENQIKMLSSINSGGEGNSFLVIRPVHKDLTSSAPCNKELPQYKEFLRISSPAPTSIDCNSIIGGVLDSTVKQWVHMVCGLWTPGTRCPNVDTMSAFDVSGVCTPEAEVCSICERPGGSCISCRVVGCDVPFHPWCAHQKGLLQSEVEGDDNEGVGFYGRCLLHATNHHFEPGSYHLDSGNAVDGHKKLTCARTEGYKGRKQDGVRYNLPPKSDGCVGSLFVPQEQLDAWIHINRQKPRRKGPLKRSSSEIERDCRKEYARYKQSRGWKHLVVYKSGIHGLGLYTSQFISRGAMVVEYVGEIVGLRVADKRETEYQSGKKLQYKSACYFFRIDKEYIIDATRKGGIARFVNHSCQPNCVAEIISVRNEKKVVFFAERDIYPGEEVTYDYHFNHEDEGKKIPCYCNSKNCRRYLN